MLDKTQVFQKLQTLLPHLNNQWYQEYVLALEIWENLIKNRSLEDKVKDIIINNKTDKSLPIWFLDNINNNINNNLDKNLSFKQFKEPYTVLAVDGSQIYPDRHHAVTCCLINIGIVELAYNPKDSKAVLSSVPYIYSLDKDNSFDCTPENTDCKRTEHELNALYEYGVNLKNKSNSKLDSNPIILLCDGSLIFWHLEHKYPEVKQRYLTSYLEALDNIYKAKLPIIGYISMPKSKELINIIRVILEQNLIKNKDDFIFNSIIDTDILGNYLENKLGLFQSTIIFDNTSFIVKYYPDYLKPCYIYIMIKDEIVRLEFPAWLKEDKDLLYKSIEIIIDQAIKGHGYPVSLSEAHEQAVVKNSDRDFFYHMLNKVNKTCPNNRYHLSKKSLKKRLVFI